MCSGRRLELSWQKHWKTLLLASGILIAGGTAAYVQSRFRVNNHDLFGHCNGHSNDKEVAEEVVKDVSTPKNKQKKGLKSLQVLAAILLSGMGKFGASDLLGLVAIAVLRTALSNRLAKVQGFLFRAAFLRRVPLFLRLISENILLCFLLSTIHSTSKYITGTLSLHFRKILTKLIHSHYFENMVYYKISHVDGRITNPEQRIASDVPRFCSELSEIVQDDLTAVTDGLLYTWRLCSYASPKYVVWILDLLLKYLGATVAVILIIEPFFSGHLRPDSSTLGRAEMLSNLRYHTSVIISLFQSLGTLSISARRLNRLSGYADRIYELMAVSRELSLVNEKSSLQRNASRNCIREANYIEFDGVKVVTPTGNVLVDDLTLRVESGSNLLITGPNGSGKSSLFRVLGGLWPLISGHIVKPGIGSDLNKEIFYVPQRPYTAVGTLRDQLIYPLTEDQEIELLTDRGMVELLKNVDLEYLLDRYPPEKEVNWGDELSLGEQQRLGMARLFYHKPKFAILDECTSAVTTDMEERFCAKVRAMGTSCITISHRPALVAFHDVVLSLDGEGGWSVHYKREGSSTEMGIDTMKASEKKRQSDAKAVQRAFSMSKKDSAFSSPKAQSYFAEVISSSPSINHTISPSAVPQLHGNTRVLPLRAAAMCKVLVPTVLDKQGAQLLAVAFLVVSRTWVSDRIASLNGTTVKFVLEQDKASFIRLIGLSVLQSAASSFIAPSIRQEHAWDIDAIAGWGWGRVFHMANKNIDADQRITHDLEKLTADLSGLVTGMVKPSVDILWFTWRMKLLTGQRGVAILYAYMLLGLGFLRTVTPDFGDLISQEQQLEGTFRFMHERLCTHAESVAFFGGGAREKAMVESRFRELLSHSKYLLKKKWLFGILDDFITKQLPHNVTWLLSLLYAMEHKGDRASISTQGELAHALRFLASVVSQSFLAFGDILELHRKFVELSGGINRIFELEELLDAAQSGDSINSSITSPIWGYHGKDAISFSKVDIVTPTQKMLARELTCDIELGKSLLVTGPNGSGKSSIFRVLRGLWPIASGRLSRPSEDVDQEAGSGCGIFYVPQRPYTCLGTLRDQIIYPLSREEAQFRALKMHGKGEKHPDPRKMLDTHLQVILENVRLNYLLERDNNGWDANLNWEDILSLGEQQRLGMARLFFHKPKFGILDECTNATSVDVEEHLYGLANKMGITVVTSSQRPALIPFHSMELRLIDGEGLKKESLVVELRQSKIWGSHVVGKGEIPWKAIFESPNMEFKEWVKMDLVSGIDCEDVMFKAPQVQVEIKIQVEKENNNRRKRLNNRWDECGCKQGHDQHAWCSAEDYDIFALGAVLEAF
ncbi:hypothetical protein JHK87_048732 [Glycine soja]|nr:hypothetical protein JHK87_048732 [Glycine soja]